MRVLITDGNERAALAVTRALGQRQIEVIVGADRDRSLAGASRYCLNTVRYPSPYDSPKGFGDFLLETVKQRRIGMLIPISDLAMQLVGERRSEFDAHTMIPAPALDVYDAVSDKCRLTQLARQLRIPVPDTIFVEDGRVPEDLRSVGDFPLIVKPGRSRMLVDGKWTNTTVRQVSHRVELERLYQDMAYLRSPSLIQRRVEGEGQGVFALYDHGTPVALFAHRRIREKPPSGGVSVLRESIEIPKPMADYAARILQSVGWHGVAMVEFKVERGTGIPRLMEINGRFWGSLQLAIDAGLNFPYLLYQAMNGVSVVVQDNSYRIGTKSRWLLGDLDHLLLRLGKSKAQLHLGSEAPSRWRCLLEFSKLFQRDLYYEIERLSDLGPAFLEYRTWLSQLGKSHS